MVELCHCHDLNSAAKSLGTLASSVTSPPVVVVLVDDGDGARVQVDPEEVGPDLHAALQPVAPLDPIQAAVHRVHAHRARRRRRCGRVSDTMQVTDVGFLSFKAGVGVYLSAEAGSWRKSLPL